MRYLAVKTSLIFSILLIFLSDQATGKRYTKCGLTQELLRLGFPRSFVGNWVCLVESESGKDTAIVTNRARGHGLGLFQINDKDWCAYGRPGGSCGIKCEDLVNEDLIDDSVCAKRIFDSLGFQNWNGWVRSCKGRNLPIPSC